ncbi:hypothetical protein BDW22DRAFT_1364263 [Trametopsis cervina]|nr:hypothetical protein BDW22DRAFT_1364263 [Trametopsis cervina]
MAELPSTLPAVTEQPPAESMTRVHTPSLIHQSLYLHELPIEIIIQIFTLVLIDRHEFVVILAQLSRYLRQIVLSTPELWSTVSPVRKTNAPEMARLWRSRNNGLVKALCIHSFELAPIQEIFYAFEAFCDLPLDALRILTIDGWAYRSICIFLPNLAPSVMAKLHSLHLRDSNDAWLNEVSGSLSLRCLIAEHSLIDFLKLADHATELRHLVYVDEFILWSTSDVLWVLHRNPNLQSIYIDSNGWNRIPNGDRPEPSSLARELPSCIVVPHLASLTIAGRLEGLWPGLSLPNLRAVDFTSAWQDIYSLLINLRSNGSVLNLVSLSLSIRFPYAVRDDLLQRAVIQFLREAKQLEYLQLFSFTYIKDIIHALSQEPTELCPNLATLDLSQCNEACAELLVPLVEARNGQSFNIERQVLDSHDGASGDGHARVSPLQKLVLNKCRLMAVDQVILPWLKQRVSHVTCDYKCTQRERQVKPYQFSCASVPLQMR